MRARRQHGFTLTELMIAVAIVAVLASLAVTLLRTNPQPVDVAAQISSKLAETSRKAVTYAAVRSDVAAALGSKARTRAELVASSNGVTMTLYVLQEDAAPAVSASWLELSSVKLDSHIVLAGYTTSAVLTSGGAPAITVGSAGTFDVMCVPDGTCEGMTIYLTDMKGVRKARVVVLPLGGAPMTFDTW